MKRCPECRRDYYDDTLLYCLDDGNALLEGPASGRRETGDGSLENEPATAILSEPGAVATGFRGGEDQTRPQINTTDQTAIFPRGAEAEPRGSLGDLPEKPRFWHKKRASVAEAGNRSAHRAAKPLVVAGVVAVFLISGFFGYRYLSPTTSKQIESIAVMPFVNESGNPDVEYLSDGMTETLITSLSQLPNLSVKPRSTVFRYKGKETDARTIGKELNVQAILNGRVVQRGDQLTLSLELIDVEKDIVLWSQQYNRKQADLVTLQTDIARDVSSKLKTKLSGGDVAKVEKNTAANPEAYQLYLKGLFQRNRRTGESLKQAAELFKQAIEKDPNYAPAYVGLGSTLQSFPIWGLALPKDCFPQAKAAALRALELDDSLAEAHVILGVYLERYEWDWIGSEKEFRRAIELDPNNPMVHANLGNAIANQKRFDEAIALTKRAVELDPLSKRGDLGQALIYSRRYDEAIAEMKAALLLDPNYADTYWNLGKAYLCKGSYQEAIAAMQRYLELDDDPVTRAMLAFAQAKAGNREAAVKQLDRLTQESSRRYVSGYAFALVYLALDKKDEALTWLEKDVEDRSIWAVYYAVDPLLDEVRDEPRFKAMLKRMNLPE